MERIVAGVIYESLIEWKKHISSVMFLHGCNLNCEYCHTKHLIKKEEHQYSLNIREAIEILKRNSKVDAVVVTGGEPLIHKNITYILRELRNIKKHIKINTNGSYFSVLENIIKRKLVDCVRLSIKESSDVKKTNEYIDLFVKHGIDYELVAVITPSNIRVLSDKIESINGYVEIINAT